MTKTIQQNAAQQLAEYKKIIDQDITTFSQQLSKNTSKEYNRTVEQMVDAYADILSRGGKRLRGALVIHAYFMAGGTDKKFAAHDARCIEMVHEYLLVVDDIADCSETRRSGLAANKILEQHHEKNNLYGDGKHFGTSQAMHVALFGLHSAIEEITKLTMPDATKIAVLSHLNKSLITTIAGQVSDVYNEALREVSEQSVRQVLTWKTAYYSFLNPLQFGVILAGKDFNDYPWLNKYAVHVGLSFQITDDILGVFADESESGKSTLDDLREGKITLLVAKTLQKATTSQKKTFLNILGKQTISRKEQKAVKDIMQKSGALQETKDTASEEAAKAIFALAEAPIELQHYVRFFDGLALYITQRRS